MDSRIEPIEQVKNHIKEGQNFVLQGGAGSGKTETLKEIIEYIAKEFPNKKIACITHTNLAVDEIKSRVGEPYTISTIHSFLNSHIKDYKKNIHKVIFEIFRLDYIERKESDFYADEKEQNKAEHEKYKKIYEKYAKKLFSIDKVSMPKVPGKREYDKNPEKYNEELNARIKPLNDKILQIINDSNFNNIKYNETRFDSFKDLTFGHDGLLAIAHLLFEKYVMLRKILQDKYDYIFIDEYQDTDEKIINVFLDKVANEKTTIGLFGDSMQGIYDSGIGEVEGHIKEGKLVKVEKEDNYRCSEQVIDFINQYRNDEITQEVALKKQDGIVEKLEQRQGIVKLYYANYPDKKPSPFSPIEVKEQYSEALIALLEKAERNHPDCKKLMLTNKAIAGKVGFKVLYDIFNARYFDIKDEIEKDLTTLQLMDLAELCNAYEKQNYNFVLTELKKAGFVLKNAKDKVKIKEHFDKIISSDISAIETLEIAFKLNLLKKADSYSTYIARKDSFLTELEDDAKYQTFKDLFNKGHNTFVKMNKVENDLTNDEFNELSSLLKKENFYLDFFSDKLKFQEIINYHKYLNEETEYITMHKTKGSGIENVLVVLDEFFWTEYDFKTIFNPDETDIIKKNKNQKLFYVACSRAIKNLICVKLINSDEDVEHIKTNFPNVEEVSLI